MPFAVGGLCQNAYVVDNIETAVTYWTQVIGVGPFFRFPRMSIVSGTLHGAPNIPRFGAAIAYSGELTIELVQPDGPSIFQDFADQGGTGVHHNCLFTDDFSSETHRLVQAGGSIIQSMEMSDGSLLAYIQMDGPTPIIIEVAQLSSPARGLFDKLHRAAQDWDRVTPYFLLSKLT